MPHIEQAYVAKNLFEVCFGKTRWMAYSSEMATISFIPEFTEVLGEMTLGRREHHYFLKGGE